jgi:DNA polymerase III sliding clamp (beta) subunit (PCNA family)
MNRKELVDTLELVGRALADGDLVPIFKCFTFNGSEVAAYNDVLGIVTKCETEQSFGVDGKTLLGLLKNSYSEEVEIDFEGHDLVIKAGKSTFKLPFHPDDEFLFTEPEEAPDITVKIDSDFLNGLDRCLMTVAKSEAMPALKGVSITQKDKAITMYSCDGDTLTRYITTIKGNPKLPDYMIPTSFCETVLKIPEVEDATLSLSKDWAIASIGEVTVYGRIIQNDRPLDFAGQIKKKISTTPQMVDVPKLLDNALSRARIVADPESAKTILTVKGGKVTVVTDASMGIVRDVLPFKHPDVEAGVSAQLLQRSLSISEKIAITEECCVCTSGSNFFQLISNMG